MNHAYLSSVRVVTLALWLGLCPIAASAQTAAGSVVALSGAVALDRAGQRYPLQIGTAVYQGDSVATPANGKLKLRMSDGSIVSLAPGSSMRIDTYAVDGNGRRQSAVLSVGQGLLRSVTAGPPAGFEVNSAVAVSGARSTDWFVEAGAGYQQVAVLGGSVSLTSRATRRSVLVPAGSGSRVPAGGDPTPPQPLNPAEFANLIGATEEGGAPPSPPPGPPPSPPPDYYPPLGGGVVIPLPLPGIDGGYRSPRGGSGEPGGSHGGYQPPPSHTR